MQSLNSILNDSHPEPKRTLRFSLSLVLVLSFCAISISAQSEPTSKPASNESTASTPASASTQAASPNESPNEQQEAASAPATQEDSGARVDRLSALRAQIEEAKTEDERSRLRRTLADYLVALNRKSDAINELRSMSREERLDPIGFYNIANALARLGDTDAAIDSYRKAIKQRHGNYAKALNNLGVLLLRQGHWDEAQTSFIAALRLEDFRYSEASYNLGRLYSMRGEADLAIREWSRALVVQPDHDAAAIALARAYAEDGNPERGLAILDTFIARRGPNADVTAARRELMFGGGVRPEDQPAAKAVSAPVVRNDKPSRPVFREVTANQPKATTKPETEKRNSASGRRLRVDQNTYDLLKRARSAREDGNNDQAVLLYSQVLLKQEGFFPPANLELSFVLTTLKRYAEAVALLETLVAREAERYPIAYYHMGRQYEALGRLDKAATAYENAVEAFGDSNPQFLIDLSRVREKQADPVAAEAAMESYVRILQSKGRVPEWTARRLAELRQKIAASNSKSTP